MAKKFNVSLNQIHNIVKLNHGFDSTTISK